MTTPFDYVESRDDADELIEEFGAAAKLRRTVATGVAWEPTQATSDFDTFAAVIDYSARQIDGERILATDKRALVAAGPLYLLGIGSIAPPDRIVIDGVAIEIVNVATVKPAATVVMFDCQVRF